MNPSVKKYLREIGAKGGAIGGKSKSEKKIKASMENLKKAGKKKA